MKKLWKVYLPVALGLAAFAAPAIAQDAAQPKRPTCPFAEGGDPDDRASARVLYWDQKADASLGQLAIDYGRPPWRKKYEDPATFDSMTQGKIWRMGSNFWTLLDTSLPLTISARAVSPGYYFLGLKRSADGSQWSLVFIDPAKVRAARGDAFEIEKTRVEFEAPVSVQKAGTLADKLTITLSYAKDDTTHVTLKIAWGNFLVTAPIEVAVAATP